MAVRNFSYYDGSVWGGLTINMWVDAPQVTINVTGSTFKVDTAGAMKIKGTCSDSDYYPAHHQIGAYIYDNSNVHITNYYDLELVTGNLKSNTYGAVTKDVQSNTPAISTSKYFNENNPTVRTLRFTSKLYYAMTYTDYAVTTQKTYSTPSILITEYDITLDVPPTATVSPVSLDTQYVYAGMTTASVTVADATAYYGGDIDSATLTIGSQTASISGDGTLSILLNAGGTFTPVVTITDSRGQVKEYPLDPITVGIYSTPTVNFDAQRTDVNGKVADEGEYATIVTTLTFDPIAEAVAPTVAVADEDGITQTATATWYSTRASDGTLSGVISDWSTVASGSTVYGLISITGDFDTQKAYVISLTPQDSEGITGDTKTDTLQTAFYTVDFLAGGHGIAFGKPAVNVGFECGMDATFDETLTAQDMTAQEVQDFVDNLNVGGGGVAVDLVVEQGTSGDWTYRVWASGKKEAWLRASLGSLSFTRASYRAYLSYTYPTACPITFTSPVIVASASSNTSSTRFENVAWPDNKLRGYFMSDTNSTASGSVSYTDVHLYAYIFE